jgi:serine/threonine protein kinase
MSQSITTTTTLEFDIVKEIGQHGQNSQVFLAHDRQLDCPIAVKKIPKSKFSNPDKFFEEAKRLNGSEHHNVMPIKFGAVDADYIYLVMPFYPNGSLKDLITKRFLTVREILRYSLQFLTGLHHIHVKGFIHFDIKPDNILLTKNNEAVVADFGVAKNMDLFGTAENDAFYYKHIPPEYFKTSKHTMLFDIYSAGLTLYRLCNGNQSFYDQLSSIDRSRFKFAVEMGRFPDRDRFLYHIPRRLKKIIKKALSTDPSDRQATVLEMLNELSNVDEFLDWKYSKTADTEVWEKEDDERIISINLKKLANSLYELTTTKTIKASNNTTRVPDGCNKNLRADSVEQTITALLKAHD